jgi:NMD protein affecting ribosome stability and mRNA decay
VAVTKRRRCKCGKPITERNAKLCPQCSSARMCECGKPILAKWARRCPACNAKRAAQVEAEAAEKRAEVVARQEAIREAAYQRAELVRVFTEFGTYEKAGRELGISRQRAHQLAKRFPPREIQKAKPVARKKAK